MAKKGSRLLLWISAIGLLILLAVVVGVALLLDADPPGLDDEPQWLHAKINGSISDAPGTEAMLVDPADLPPLTTELTAVLRDAADDDDIAGLFLEVQGVGVGWAQAQELRDALLAFQETGKPCVAWSDGLSNKEYYLASACKELHAPPTAITLVHGLAVTQAYFGETFEKYGVSANFEHVGDFKSAVEPYERTGPSEAAQQATSAMLDSIYLQMVDGIAEGRGVTQERARAWIEDPPMSARAAHELGMVDTLSYREDVVDGQLDGKLQKMKPYLRERRRAWRSGDLRVAVLHADGAIVGGSSQSDLFGSRYVGDRTVVRQLKELREDEDIDAVVLRVNSPGGSGSASDAIWNAVGLTKAEKPVVVSMGDYAASGGYYISMGADRIYAQPGTLTGSIGVFGGKMNLAGLYGQVGVQMHTTQRGAYANLLSSTSDFTDAERAKFRTFLETFYDIFVEKAAEGRDMTRDELHAVAQGRVWTGAQALERGLIDELGGLDAAVAHAASLARERGADADAEVRIVRFPERKGFVDQLIEELTGESQDAAARAAVAALPLPAARDTLAALSRLERVLADPAAALLPGDLTIR